MSKVKRRIVIRYKKHGEGETATGTVVQPPPRVERMAEIADDTLAKIPGGRPVLRCRPAKRDGSPLVERRLHGGWDPVLVVIDGRHKGRTGTKAELSQYGQVHVPRHAHHREIG